MPRVGWTVPLLGVSLLACATQLESKQVTVSADAVRKAMADLEEGAPATTLRDQSGHVHRADGDTFVGIADTGRGAPPSVALSALRVGCGVRPPVASLPCPVTYPQATYIARVQDRHSSLSWPDMPWAYLLGGTLVVGAGAAEAGCFAKWCDGTGRGAVITADVVVLAAVGFLGFLYVIQPRGD